MEELPIGVEVEVVDLMQEVVTLAEVMVELVAEVMVLTLQQKVKQQLEGQIPEVEVVGPTIKEPVQLVALAS
jgi:hypothetical protein